MWKKEDSVEEEAAVLELGGKIYGAILAGAGARGGTYGEEDLRRYARYSVKAAEVYYEEFFASGSESGQESGAGEEYGGSVGERV